MVVPLYVENLEGDAVRTYALLDGGSTRHIIADSIGEKLGISGKVVNLSISSYGREVCEE